MKRTLALVLALVMVLSLLTACGKKNRDDDRKTAEEENSENTEQQSAEEIPATADPYDAVKTYWSDDQLTQAWGPDQIVEHLFFHPIIAYPQWAFHDCPSSQSQKNGLDDWMVTVDEYNKILQSVYEKGYILVAMEDVWSEYT
ncbi:MAG: hydrolase, partial [Oscillospiraceae bacterium]|nr:hydrolase [Oscillospiraceae bacterium]